MTEKMKSLIYRERELIVVVRRSNRGSGNEQHEDQRADCQ